MAFAFTFAFAFAFAFAAISSWSEILVRQLPSR